uniref:Transglutaminase-like domain-containing protein n=1 Tax=Candidatus Komeilibacteria bacterium CG_4_10_14_0_8_um_filter_37_78 TaxID=1974471 RepID=A0A2M7REQ9_9BACT|nr:MAG: hypothetical protein COY67_01620 [Candidatus Komeilibacteria bacterium CG_4_10_14_0_8_um_filter_37_78]
MREQFIQENVDKAFIAQGLAGLDSPQAWAMREQFIKENVRKGMIALSINGYYITFVWRLNRKEKTNLPLKLQKKLDLLNLVNKPTLEGINNRFDQEDKEAISVEEKIRSGLSNSQRFAGQVSEMIKEVPQIFLDTMSSKKDRLRHTLVNKTLNKIFPELLRPREKSAWRNFAGYFGLDQSRDYGEIDRQRSPQDYLNPDQNIEFMGGDPRSEDDAKKEIMQLRDNINELISTGLFGKYDSNSNRWSKTFFVHEPTIMEPVKETTITLPAVAGLRQVNLPKLINSRVIKDRIKGIDNNGQEILLESSANSLGEVVAEIPKNIKKIVYSLEYNQAPKIMRQLTEHDYRNYHRQFSSKFGNEMNQKMCHLPEEIVVFINSIAELEPKEKVKVIEGFVREYSYYDFDNKDVIPLKSGKGLEELLMIMETRMAELKQLHPELSDQLNKKRFAGVCYDFNMLITAMLREAGLTAGFTQGFMAHDKSVRLNSSHCTAFVVWPDELNKNAVFTVDGTPSGVTAEQNEYLDQLRQPSIKEKESRSAELIEEIKKEAEEKLEEILETLQGQDSEAIKKLTNGQLESVLNTILTYEVKQPHWQVLKRVMEAYWYSPAAEMDMEKESGQLASFLTSEINSQREIMDQEVGSETMPGGSALLNTIKDFADKFIAGQKVDDKAQAFDLIEDIIELASQALNDTEKRAITAIVTYLRAKKMVN